jgi:hypothetical protein
MYNQKRKIMRSIARITLFVAFISFLTFQAFSQTGTSSSPAKEGANKQNSSTAVPGKFTDKNNDGICDNHQERMKNGKCTTFVDKNGDGVCDNCKSNCKGTCCGKGNCQGKGQACGNGNKHRNGCCNQPTKTSQKVNPTEKN